MWPLHGPEHRRAGPGGPDTLERRGVLPHLAGRLWPQSRWDWASCWRECYPDPLPRLGKEGLGRTESEREKLPVSVQMFISFPLLLSPGFFLRCSFSISLFPRFLYLALSPQGSLSLCLTLGMPLFIPVAFPKTRFWRHILVLWYVFVSLRVSLAGISPSTLLSHPEQESGRRVGRDLAAMS